MLFCIGTGEPGAPAPAEGGGSVLRLLSNQNFNPTRLIVVSFGAIILLGTFLLHLPISARDGQFTPWLTCLFTATSATCVTGLVLVDSALYWTPFGQGVILAMIQLGGLGFVSLISLIPLLLRRRIGLSQRLAIASAFNLNGMSGVVRVVRHALMGTFLLEGCGAILLATRFVPLFGWGRGLWYSIFHSVSAFCNAGFDLMGEHTGAFSSLAGFREDPVVLGTIGCLIVLGGLGFFVWEDCLEHRSWRRLSFYSRMVLAVTGALILGGWLFFLGAEWNNLETLGGMTAGEKVGNALFQSVTLRTAGYSVLDQGALRDGAAALSVVLMLIGGSSGSTAGGIKTATAGVLLISLWAGLRGERPGGAPAEDHPPGPGAQCHDPDPGGDLPVPGRVHRPDIGGRGPLPGCRLRSGLGHGDRGADHGDHHRLVPAEPGNHHRDDVPGPGGRAVLLHCVPDPGPGRE